MRRSSKPILSFNFWPSFTDVCLITVLVLILIIFIQIITNAEAFKLKRIQDKQIKIRNLIVKAIGTEARDAITFRSNFAIQRIKFSDWILFAKSSAELQKHGMELLYKVGKVLKDNETLYHAIRVEGHTDKDPIRSGKYPSNWELSSARATAVVRYFDEVVGIRPDNGRLAAVGFSKYVPIDPGDSEEAKAKNRRIELAIYYDAK